MANNSRLIFVEPNCSDRDIPAIEDLSILVSLTTTRKSRSTIVEGEVQSTPTSSARPIGFIDGTNVGGGRRSLTTNYTEISTNFAPKNKFGEEENDLETLGIDSIDINFDTAYTPMIKIKFIDIRGNAVLSKGNDSKYKMFFDLPFPIFDLTVKGFYGKAVKYCLHLTKWNASFNSSTGNFEIDTEFIGYTYALLTDCLIGYMRANVYTDIGASIFLKYKNMENEDNTKKYPQLIPIDEFLDYVQKINDEFQKVKQSNPSIKQINALTTLSDKITRIETRLNELKGTSISGSEGKRDLLKQNEKKLALLNQTKSGYDGNVKELIDKKRQTYKTLQKREIESINKTIEKSAPNLKLKEDYVCSGIQILELKFENNQLTFLNSVSLSKNEKDNIINTIASNTNLTDGKYFLFDFTVAYDEIFRVQAEIRIMKDTLDKNLTKTLKEKVSKLSFKPTIRNIVNMLCIHAQIFLETLNQVSENAERKTNTGRIQAIQSTPMFIKSDKNKNKPIYSWPEYNSKENGQIVESWMGAALKSGDYKKVNEVMFVEELLSNLMKIARKDELRALTGSANIPDFFPVSPLEAKINLDDKPSLITKNPYFNALKSELSIGSPDEAFRCLLYRVFTALGVTNRLIGANQLEVIGKLEADNLVSVLNSDFDLIPRNTFIQTILDYTKLESKEISGATDALIDLFLGKKGGLSLTHPPNNTDGIFMEVVGSDYTYKYIRNDGYFTDKRDYISYIPINKSFDGQDFFNGKKFKTSDELKELSKSVIFTSDMFHFKSYTKNNDDGAIFFKILIDDKGENLDKGKPTKSNSIALEQYKEKIDEEKLLTENEGLKSAVYADDGDKAPVFGDKLDMYNGIYKTLNLDNIQYAKTSAGARLSLPQKEFKGTVIKSYFEGAGSFRGTLLQKRLVTKETDKLPTGGPFGEFIVNYGGGSSNSGGNGYTKPKTYFGLNTLTIDWNKESSYVALIKTIMDVGGGGLPINQVTNKVTSELNGFFPNASTDHLVYDVITNGGVPITPLAVLDVSMSIVKELSSFTTAINPDMSQTFSLFGSEFYYTQITAGKAFLYLHSIGWKGVVGGIGDTEIGTDDENEETLFNLFDDNRDSNFTTKAIYGNNASFTKAPKLWCAFIGALLIRYDNMKTEQLKGVGTGDIVSFKNLPWQTKNTYRPQSNEYLRHQNSPRGHAGISLVMSSESNNKDENYPTVDRVILDLPKQVRDEFKKAFKIFLTGDFKEIQKNYELFKDEKDLRGKWLEIRKEVQLGRFSNKGEFEGLNNIVYDDGLLTLKKKIKIVKGKEVLDFNYERTNNVDLSKVLQVKELKRVLSGNFTTSSFTIPLTNTVLNTPVSKFNSQGELCSTIMKNYRNISPINNENWNDESEYLNKRIYQFDLTMLDNDLNSEVLARPFYEVYDIMNATPRVFRPKNPHNTKSNAAGNYSFPADTIRGTFTKNGRYEISAPIDQFSAVIDNFFKRFVELTASTEDEDDKIQQRIFNNVDDDIIKLNIYRTLSAINDKWLGSKTNKKCSNITEIVESFRFLDSGFLDIGDEFLVNPLSIQQKIIGNYNQSFFDIVNGLLIENNFNFIALPSYIDFSDEENMRKSIFKPIPWNATMADEAAGAKFICVYVGQKSANLDLGNDSEHEDDGFHIKSTGDCDEKNKQYRTPVAATIPNLFTNRPGNKVNPKDSNIPYFLVSYGKGNQSIFKDIKLDQREFTETAESLEIIDDISQTGNKNKASFKGQNLFNTYQKRAYSAEVEMMGCAAIQPMMYFQLNNIPMFRGAYLIHKTTHSITANNMKTTFKGSRIKKVKTLLITEAQLFQTLIGSISEGGQDDTITGLNETISNTNSSIGVLAPARPGSWQAKIQDIVSNKSTSNPLTSDTTIDQKAIDNSAGLFKEINGKIYLFDSSNGLAGKELKSFLKDISKYVSEALPKKNLQLASNGVMRELQETVAGGRGRSKKSKHAAGLAIDIQFLGDYYSSPTTFKNMKNAYTKDKTVKITEKYGYPDGNNVAVLDHAVMTTIRQFIDTSPKWKDLIKWGGDFKGGKRENVKSTISGISDFSVRINEIHHFEIYDDKMGPYWKPWESNLKAMGLSIPTKQNDFTNIFAAVLKFKGDRDLAIQNIKNDKTEGDGVSNDTIGNDTTPPA